MANPSVTNVDGSNPGPNSASPDFPQSEIGNVWKMGSFTVQLSPATIAGTTSSRADLHHDRPFNDRLCVCEQAHGTGRIGYRRS